MKRCISCGRIIKDDTAGNGNKELKYCVDCLDENGKLKTYDQVSESLAKYLIRTQGLDEKAALNAAKAIASSQPEWDKKQGVYFEKDMKKRKRTIIALVLSLILFVSGTGFGLWYFNREDKVVNHFEDGKDHLITREVGSHTIYELDLPGRQFNPIVVSNSESSSSLSFNNSVLTWADFSSPGNYDGFIFSSEKLSGETFRPFGYGLCGYNITKGFGKEFGDKEFGDVRLENLWGPYFDVDNEMVVYKNNSDDSQHICSSYIPDSLIFKEYGHECQRNRKSIWRRREPNFYYRNDSRYFSINTNCSDSFVYPQMNENHLIWCDEDTELKNRSLYLKNINNGKTVKVCDSVIRNSKPFLLDNFILWEDNRTMNSTTNSLYCYNIKKNQEYSIFTSESQIFLCSANNRYAIFFVFYKDNPKQTMFIYDLFEQTLVKKYDNFAPDIWASIKGGWSNSFEASATLGSPHIFISDDIEFPLLIWPTNRDDSNEKFLQFLRIGKGGEPKIISIDDGFKYQTPLAVSNDHILFLASCSNSDETTFWISKISDEGAVVETIKLDEVGNNSRYELDGWGNFKISDYYVFWSIEYRTENAIYCNDKKNICWAKISDIFPENTTTVGMEE